MKNNVIKIKSNVTGDVFFGKIAYSKNSLVYGVWDKSIQGIANIDLNKSVELILPIDVRNYTPLSVSSWQAIVKPEHDNLQERAEHYLGSIVLFNNSKAGAEYGVILAGQINPYDASQIVLWCKWYESPPYTLPEVIQAAKKYENISDDNLRQLINSGELSFLLEEEISSLVAKDVIRLNTWYGDIPLVDNESDNLRTGSALRKTADPLTYTDISDVKDPIEHMQDRSLVFHQNDKVEENIIKDQFPGEPTHEYNQPGDVYDSVFDNQGDSYHARWANTRTAKYLTFEYLNKHYGEEPLFIYLGIPKEIGKLIQSEDEIHVTLVYFPKVRLGKQKKQELIEKLSDLAKKIPEIKCEITGLAKFNSQEAPIVGLVNMRYGAEIYSEIIKILQSVGIEDKRIYNFIPHVTIKYDATLNQAPSLPEDKSQLEWTAENIYIEFGKTENKNTCKQIKLGTGEVRDTLPLDTMIKTSTTRVHDLSHAEDYSNYNVLDVSPTEEVKHGPTDKHEEWDPDKYKLDKGDEHLIFERGLHNTVENVNTGRPVIPFASNQSLSWMTEPNNVEPLQHVTMSILSQKLSWREPSDTSDYLGAIVTFKSDNPQHGIVYGWVYKSIGNLLLMYTGHTPEAAVENTNSSGSMINKSEVISIIRYEPLPSKESAQTLSWLHGEGQFGLIKPNQVWKIHTINNPTYFIAIDTPEIIDVGGPCKKKILINGYKSNSVDTLIKDYYNEGIKPQQFRSAGQCDELYISYELLGTVEEIKQQLDVTSSQKLSWQVISDPKDLIGWLVEDLTDRTGREYGVIHEIQIDDEEDIKALKLYAYWGITPGEAIDNMGNTGDPNYQYMRIRVSDLTSLENNKIQLIKKIEDISHTAELEDNSKIYWVYDRDTGVFIREATLSEISEIYKVRPAHAKRSIENDWGIGGIYILDPDRYKTKPLRIKNRQENEAIRRGKRVIGTNPETKAEYKFDSVGQAARELGVSRGAIFQALKSGGVSAGLIWRYDITLTSSLHTLAWTEPNSFNGWLVKLRSNQYPEEYSSYSIAFVINTAMNNDRTKLYCWIGETHTDEGKELSQEEQEQSALNKFKQGEQAVVIPLDYYKVIPLRQVLDVSKIASDQQTPHSVAQDILLLYKLEPGYSFGRLKLRDGDDLTDREYLDYNIAKQQLPKLFRSILSFFAEMLSTTLAWENAKPRPDSGEYRPSSPEMFKKNPYAAQQRIIEEFSQYLDQVYSMVPRVDDEQSWPEIFILIDNIINLVHIDFPYIQHMIWQEAETLSEKHEDNLYVYEDVEALWEEMMSVLEAQGKLNPQPQPIESSLSFGYGVDLSNV